MSRQQGAWKCIKIKKRLNRERKSGLRSVLEKFWKIKRQRKTMSIIQGQYCIFVVISLSSQRRSHHFPGSCLELLFLQCWDSIGILVLLFTRSPELGLSKHPEDGPKPFEFLSPQNWLKFKASLKFMTRFGSFRWCSSLRMRNSSYWFLISFTCSHNLWHWK